MTGQPETEGYLRDIGDTRIIPRNELVEPATLLEAETWPGCIDTVGGVMLARMMGADNGAVDHLERARNQPALVEGLQDIFPQPRKGLTP